MQHMYLEDCLSRLKAHFQEFYASPVFEHQLTTAGPAQKATERFDFFSRYRNSAPQLIRDEIKDFLILPRETWDGCDPIQWWSQRCHLFPNLSRLARDIFSIPGMV
jgi:hypothetical protein